jgi:Rho-type GTPase-activating protein 1/2
VRISVNTAEVAAAKLGRSLMMRLDNIKAQYLNELLPLSQQREALSREIAELKGVRDVFLEETTVLNARNEELAKLSALYTRRMDTVMPETAPPQTPPKQSNSFDRPRQQPPPLLSVSASLSTSTSTLSDERTEARTNKPSLDAPSMKPKFIKWPGSKTKEPNALNDNARTKVVTIEHAFQHVNVLRFTRCDHCGDKLWGSQLRCSGKMPSCL